MIIPELIEQLKVQEGFRSKPYQCTEGYLTIGYGRNLETNGITKDEAEELLINDVQKVETALTARGLLGKNHNEARRAVLINMAFQMGVSGLVKFKKTLSAYLNQQYLTASKEMLDSKWAKQTPNRAMQLSEQMRKGEWQ